MREHWREPRFWRWWWRERVPPELRAGSIIAALGLALGGGLFVASLTMSHDKVATAGVLYARTDRKVVTVRERGRVVRKIVPVVKVVRLRPSTAVKTDTATETRYVTTPGGVRVVEHRVVHLVPVVRVRRHTVTVAGKTHTVGVTVRVPTTHVVTRTQTLTNDVTVPQTVTQVTTVRGRGGPPQTVTQTQTQTQVQTVTSTETDTQTQTVTITLPTTVLQTVTVTTTRGGG